MNLFALGIFLLIIERICDSFAYIARCDQRVTAKLVRCKFTCNISLHLSTSCAHTLNEDLKKTAAMNSLIQSFIESFHAKIFKSLFIKIIQFDFKLLEKRIKLIIYWAIKRQILRCPNIVARQFREEQRADRFFNLSLFRRSFSRIFTVFLLSLAIR